MIRPARRLGPAPAIVLALATWAGLLALAHWILTHG